MSKPAQSDSKHNAAPTKPVDVVDGIPNRSPKRGRWKLLLLLAIFAAWIAALIYIQIVGRPQ